MWKREWITGLVVSLNKYLATKTIHLELCLIFLNQLFKSKTKRNLILSKHCIHTFKLSIWKGQAVVSRI